METLPISVVIPVYNRQKELTRALNSVLAQTSKPSEIIVVDDCSPIPTEIEVADRLVEIKLFVNPTNLGAAATRNVGVSHTRNDWIAFIDSDDIWHCRKLESVWELISMHPKSALLYNDLAYTYDGIRTFSSRKLVAINCVKEALLHGWTPPSTSCITVKKEVYMRLGGFDVSLQTCEDHDYWMTLCKNGYTIYGTDRILTTILLTGNDRLSHNLSQRKVSVHMFLSKWLPWIRSELGCVSSYAYQMKYLALVYTGIFRLLLSQFKITIAISVFLHYLCWNPYFFKRAVSSLVRRIYKFSASPANIVE